jgi:cytochrome b561
MNKPKRYHPLIVTLHWLVAVLTFVNLLLGLVFFRSASLPNPVGIHMLVGLLLLALIIVRFVARFLLKRPADATTGSKMLDWIGKAVHYSLYFFIALVTIIGLLFSLRTEVFQFTFFENTALESLDFGSIPMRVFGVSIFAIHGISAYILLFLVSLHVLAAIYHQFFLKDKLLSRMWYGNKE